jgi:hypothetical protein
MAAIAACFTTMESLVSVEARIVFLTDAACVIVIQDCPSITAAGYMFQRGLSGGLRPAGPQVRAARLPNAVRVGRHFSQPWFRLSVAVAVGVVLAKFRWVAGVGALSPIKAGAITTCQHSAVGCGYNIMIVFKKAAPRAQ